MKSAVMHDGVSGGVDTAFDLLEALVVDQPLVDDGAEVARRGAVTAVEHRLGGLTHAPPLALEHAVQGLGEIGVVAGTAARGAGQLPAGHRRDLALHLGDLRQQPHARDGGAGAAATPQRAER